jgi:hypothetical protein
MKRGMKVLLAVGAVLALASSPGWSNCSFSFPIFQGGFSGQNPATFMTGGVAPYSGDYWQQGFGQVADGAGIDSGTVLAQVFFDQAGDGGYIRNDWGNAGVDGCPNSAGSAGDAVPGASTVAFVNDSAGNYVVIGAAHWAQPVPSVDMDNIGQDQPFEPQFLTPAINIDLGSITPTTVVADVLPAAASVNCYDDGSGICSDPATIVVDEGTILTEGSGGPAVPGCEAGGCSGVTLNRGQQYCWDGGATVAGQVIPGSGLCSVAPLPCTDSAYCAGLTLGVCNISPPTVEAFGAVEPGCVLIADTTVADQAINTVAGRSKGHVLFTWDVNEFGVAQMQVIAVGRHGERQLNEQPIFARANDGSLQSYEALIPNGNIKGDKEFKIRVIGNDGTVKDTPVGLQ